MRGAIASVVCPGRATTARERVRAPKAKTLRVQKFWTAQGKAKRCYRTTSPAVYVGAQSVQIEAGFSFGPRHVYTVQHAA